MRLLGVLIIMIAHSSPPAWLFQLRNFGTPLLIVASALTYSFIYSSRSIDVVDFYQKRLKRLILPAWIFLSFFFFVFYIVTNLSNIDYPFSIRKIVFSYAFMDGIGFVWILKVYIILALITPFTLQLNKKVKSNNYYFLMLMVAYLIYEMLVYFLSPAIGGLAGQFFNQIVLIAFSYSILYCYGFRLSKLNDKTLYGIIIVSFLIFSSLAFIKYSQTGHFVGTQGFKYPPTLYYLSYAFFATNTIYLLCRNLKFANGKTSSIIIWLSSNSLWIYLWHIMAYYIWNFTIGDPKGDLLMFCFKTLFLLFFGIFLTLLQGKLVEKLIPQDSYYGKQISELLT